MPPLRILFVTNNFTPYSGGVVSSIQSFVRELQQEGHTVLIATLDFAGLQEKDPSHIVRIACPLTFTHKKNPMALPWRSTVQLEKIMATFKPDLIHTHHPFLLGNAALAGARKNHIPIVFTYHTMYEHYAHYVPLPTTLTRWALEKRVPSFCASVDGVIAPSSSIKDLIKKKGKTKSLTVIPSPLQEPFLPAKTFTPKVIHKPFRLLLVSRLVKEKNIPFLLNVFAQLDQKAFTFTLIGYGDEYEALQHYAYQTLHLSQAQVQFIHKPPKNIIRKHYEEHDLFLFSSQSDTQGLVLAESMAAGTPVIALDGPGQRDIIAQGHNGYIVQNAEQMKTVINTIAQNKSLHQQIQQKAWQTAQRYIPETTTQELIAFYRKFIAA